MELRTNADGLTDVVVTYDDGDEYTFAAVDGVKFEGPYTDEASSMGLYRDGVLCNLVWLNTDVRCVSFLPSRSNA